MPADLGFVMHAAQARAYELEPDGSRDALAERGLADAGRADEAEDRAAARRIELAHREVLEDAPLDLLEAVVVRVENLARLGDVDGFRVALRPRQCDEPIEVRAHHRMLRRGVRHAFEAPQLLQSLLLHLLGHLGVRNRLAQVVELGLGVVLAELLLDRLQLLAQHVLALALVELALRLLADFARQLEHLDAVRQDLDDAIEPIANLQSFENRLLLGRLDVDEPADHVGERARRLDVLQRRRELRRHLRQEIDGLDGLLLQQRRAGLDLGVGVHVIWDQVEARREERQPVQVVERAKALLALADEMMHAVRRLQVAHDANSRADAVQILRLRRVDARILLQHDAELVAMLHGFLRRAHRKVASQRHLGDGARKHDEVAHGDDE